MNNYNDLNLDILISLQAQKYGDKVFLISSTTGIQLSYRDFDHRTRIAVQLIKKKGIKAGDVLGLMVYNSIEFVIAYFSAMRLGITLVPMNINLKDEEIYNILTHSGAKAIIASDEKLPELRLCIQRLSNTCLVISEKTFSVFENYANKSDLHINRKAHPKEVALILYTSGTTGKPKGIVLTQRNLIINAQDIADALQINGLRMMCILPLHHTNGQIINILTPFVSGGSVVLCESYSVFNLTQFWETINKYSVNVVDVVPTILNILMQFKARKRIDVKSLQYIICGAAPLSKEMQIAFEQKFNCKILQEYGLTEGTCVSSINNQIANKPGTIGRSLLHSQIKIVDELKNELPVNAVGEIAIRGEEVMLEYFKDPQKTDETIIDNWLYTGDLGKKDEDGFFVVLGRKKDIIIKGGENIYPVDIENVISRHLSVVECVVMGIPDVIYGETIKTYIVKENDNITTEQEIIEFCKNYLPLFWCPSQVYFISQIPRTPSGKVIKHLLQ